MRRGGGFGEPMWLDTSGNGNNNNGTDAQWKPNRWGGTTPAGGRAGDPASRPASTQFTRPPSNPLLAGSGGASSSFVLDKRASNPDSSKRGYEAALSFYSSEPPPKPRKEVPKIDIDLAKFEPYNSPVPKEQERRSRSLEAASGPLGAEGAVDSVKRSNSITAAPVSSTPKVPEGGGLWNEMLTFGTKMENLTTNYLLKPMMPGTHTQPTPAADDKKKEVVAATKPAGGDRGTAGGRGSIPQPVEPTIAPTKIEDKKDNLPQGGTGRSTVPTAAGSTALSKDQQGLQASAPNGKGWSEPITTLRSSEPQQQPPHDVVAAADNGQQQQQTAAENEGSEDEDEDEDDEDGILPKCATTDTQDNLVAGVVMDDERLLRIAQAKLNQNDALRAELDALRVKHAEALATIGQLTGRTKQQAERIEELEAEVKQLTRHNTKLVELVQQHQLHAHQTKPGPASTMVTASPIKVPGGGPGGSAGGATPTKGKHGGKMW